LLPAGTTVAGREFHPLSDTWPAEVPLHGALVYFPYPQEAYQNGATLNQGLRPWLSNVQFRRLATDFNLEINEKPSAILFEQWLGIVRFICRSRHHVKFKTAPTS